MMNDKESLIDFIKVGGHGDEAEIKVELRTTFPGIGDTIKTQEGVVSALREEYNKSPLMGHKLFIKHMIIKKLEDFFYRTHVYKFSHIPRPFGSISREGYQAYLYEWAIGEEGFPWKVRGDNYKTKDVELKDWELFDLKFSEAGIIIGKDCFDKDGIHSKNIIHQFPYYNLENPKLNVVWKRIDFGDLSVGIDYEKLKDFLKKNKVELVNVLRNERYKMIELSVLYLERDEKIEDIDIGRLEILIGDYRNKTLSHYASRGSGIIDTRPFFGETTESLR